jgi:GT2 family glycosyltransferase
MLDAFAIGPGILLWLAACAVLGAQAAAWWRGLSRLRRQAAVDKIVAETPDTWLLVAARDEAAALPGLAAALAAQEGAPPPRLVLVDDGSVDGTAELARRIFAHLPGAQVLERPARGKLPALADGLERILAEAAEDDVVLFSDADCRPRAAWLASHAAAHGRGARLVCGHKVLDEGAEAHPAVRLRRFENALSSLQCALGCARGRPAFARGGNWSARAGDLERCGGLAGLESLSSGDDVHLVRRLLRTGAGRGARFLLEPGSRVDTRERLDRPALAHQARRRYGKLRELSTAERLRQGTLFFALALQPLLLLGWLAMGSPWWIAPATTLAALALATRRFLARGLALLGEEESAPRPLGLALGLVWHALRHTALGALRGYGWRERRA